MAPSRWSRPAMRTGRRCCGRWREFEFVFNDLDARDETTELAVQVQLAGTSALLRVTGTNTDTGQSEVGLVPTTFAEVVVSPALMADCVAGFLVSEATGSGAVSLQPLVLGAAS